MLNEELVDIIDENNVVIGSATRSEAYQKSLSHRVVHVLAFDGNQIFLVRRSLNVRYLPGFYCSSAGGHVHAGEAVEAAALRELEEEIGLKGPISPMVDFFFTHDFKVHVSVFKKEFRRDRDKIQLNPNEVLDGRFYDLDEATRLPLTQLHPQLIPCLKFAEKHFNDKKGSDV